MACVCVCVCACVRAAMKLLPLCSNRRCRQMNVWSMGYCHCCHPTMCVGVRAEEIACVARIGSSKTDKG